MKRKRRRRKSRVRILFTSLVLLLLVFMTAWKIKLMGPREQGTLQKAANAYVPVAEEPKEPEPEPESEEVTEPEEPAEALEEAKHLESFLPDYTSAPLQIGRAHV